MFSFSDSLILSTVAQSKSSKNFPWVDIGFHCRVRYFELFLLVRFIHQVAYYDYFLNKSGNNDINNQDVF